MGPQVLASTFLLMWHYTKSSVVMQMGSQTASLMIVSSQPLLAMSKTLQTATHISCRSLARCTRKCCQLVTLAYRLLLSQFDSYLFSSIIFQKKISFIQDLLKLGLLYIQN